MSIRIIGRVAVAQPFSCRLAVPSQRRFCAGAQPQPGEKQSAHETPGGAGMPNPTQFFEQLGQKAQEVAKVASQSIGDPAAAAGPILQNLQNGAGPILQNIQGGAGPIIQNIQGGAGPILENLQNFQGNIQGMAQPHVNQLAQELAPVLTTMLILARTSPGQSLTTDQEAKIAEVFGGDAREMFQNLNEIVPEDPQVAQLRRIAASLANIEAHLAKNTASEAAALPAEAQASACPETVAARQTE